MSRFTLHVVWLLLSTAGVAVIYGGPIWAYPLAVLLALVASLLRTAILADNPLRWALAAVGLVMVVATSGQFYEQGVTQWTVNQCLFGMMLGCAFIWSAFFPLR